MCVCYRKAVQFWLANIWTISAGAWNWMTEDIVIRQHRQKLRCAAPAEQEDLPKEGAGVAPPPLTCPATQQVRQSPGETPSAITLSCLRGTLP